MIYWKTVKEEREKSQTIRGSEIQCGSSRSTGGAGVGVVRRRHRLAGDGDGRCSGVGWRCWRRWNFPSLAAPLSLIGLGLGCRWGDWQRGRPRTLSPGPHLPFIALCDGGTNHVGLDAPDQGARTRPKGRWG
jgi:hypothetical protein